MKLYGANQQPPRSAGHFNFGIITSTRCQVMCFHFDLQRVFLLVCLFAFFNTWSHHGSHDVQSFVEVVSMSNKASILECSYGEKKRILSLNFTGEVKTCELCQDFHGWGGAPRTFFEEFGLWSQMKTYVCLYRKFALYIYAVVCKKFEPLIYISV